MPNYDRLLKKLDDVADDLGIALLSEAAEAIRALVARNTMLCERHKESRADKLAAAYSELLGRLGELDALVRDLMYWGAEEMDIDPEEIGKNLQKKLLEIRQSADPESIGAQIRADARRLPAVEEELRNLISVGAGRAGLDPAILMKLGIHAVNYNASVQDQTFPSRAGESVAVHGPTVVDLGLRGAGKGAEYLHGLFQALGGWGRRR